MIDLHQDLFLYQNWPQAFSNCDQVDLEQIRELNTKLVIVSAYAGPHSVDEYGVTELEMWEQALVCYESLDPDQFYLMKSWDDFANPENNTKTGLVFHFEGIYTDISVYDLDIWYQRGLRSIGLTWNETSLYAGGNKHPDDGLTTAGEQVIEWCLDNRVLVDLAHMSEKAFNESATTLKAVNKPLFVSHANARAICGNGQDRNLSDEQLRMIGGSGGVVGIFFARGFVSDTQPVSIDDVMRHIDHIRNMAGEDVVAIGSDFGGILSNPRVEGLETYCGLATLRDLVTKKWGDSFANKMFAANAYRVLAAYLK